MHIASERLRMLMDAMIGEVLSTPEKVAQLGRELALHYGDNRFLACSGMGELVRQSLSNLEERNSRGDLTAF
jgi:hypothetical protein